VQRVICRRCQNQAERPGCRPCHCASLLGLPLLRPAHTPHTSQTLQTPVILDCARVTIGDRVLFGPNVQVYTAGHPVEGWVRKGTAGPEFAKPITIGDDVWVGGGAIILPGVTIGDSCVVGAGAVVTKDVAPCTVVAGNPARVVRRLVPSGDAGGGGSGGEAHHKHHHHHDKN
jgi:hypothetical protein